MTALEAPPSGWSIDADDWYCRPSRPGDLKIGNRYHFGFDDSTFPSSPPQRKVYVRSADFARLFDARKALP